MPSFFIAAAVIECLTGVIHSVIGEKRIFRPLRQQGLISHLAAPPLRERHVRILWASWHALSVFGWACAAILLYRAMQAQPGAVDDVALASIAWANFFAGALVLGGTKGRHPGWIALFLVAGLTVAGMRSY